MTTTPVLIPTEAPEPTVSYDDGVQQGINTLATQAAETASILVSNTETCEKLQNGLTVQKVEMLGHRKLVKQNRCVAITSLVVSGAALALSAWMWSCVPVTYDDPLAMYYS